MKNYIKNNSIEILFILGIVVQFAILISSIYIKSVWDEDIFRNNCPLFDQYGLSRKFLLNIDIQAPGPVIPNDALYIQSDYRVRRV